MWIVDVPGAHACLTSLVLFKRWQPFLLELIWYILLCRLCSQTIGKMTPTVLMWQLASSMIMFDGDGDALNVWQISQTIPTIYATIGKMTPILPRSGSWHLPWFTREAWPRGRRGRRPPTTVSPSWILIEILDPDWDPGSWILDSGSWILDIGLKFSIQDLRKWEGGAAALLSWSSAKLPHLWIKLLISGGFWTFVKALVIKGVLPAESFCLEHEHCLCNERWALMLPQSWTGEEERWEWFYLSNQGGRSCTGAQAAPAEKFGLGQKF